MSEPGHPTVFTIPAHRAFADALAAGLLRQYAKDPLELARGTILLPTNRAVRAMQDAFIRRAETGLLLPRLVPIGDPELDETLGSALDPISAEDEIPPAIDPLRRTMRLASLVQRERKLRGEQTEAVEAIRLAQNLARTLDQLLAEQVDPSTLPETIEADLAGHWKHSFDELQIIIKQWPKDLAKLGLIESAERRNLLLEKAAQRWKNQQPPGFVVAAGITSSAPAIATLLRAVSRMDTGSVILPALDLSMPADEWTALGPSAAQRDPEALASRAESHPQFQLKLLLDRIGVAREEVAQWRWGGGRDAPAVRSRAIGNAMAPATFTAKWNTLAPRERRLTGVRAVELATPAEEAQLIALAMREALETPEKTVALITPDRVLARRVSAHLQRWGIEADDSAGRPLSQTPPGTLLVALADALADGFAPITLLTLLKHPLVRIGDERLAWLGLVRDLDLQLRGPRPRGGLAAIRERLELIERSIRRQDREQIAKLRGWWAETAAKLERLETAAEPDLPGLVAALRDTASELTGEMIWSGEDGRAASRFIADFERFADERPLEFEGNDLATLLTDLMREITVRPPYGGHPRLFIWGLIEARLQQADLMILGGLNEGTWPTPPQPDPWLAPRLRKEMGLPGLEERIGIAAHDFASALGGRQVLVTRARRDESAPTVASRFWLRLEAMTGGMTRAPVTKIWGKGIDSSAGPPALSPRPAPSPPVGERPKEISVTRVDTLRADPFSFYAQRILKLSALDPVDADPSPAWRGTIVHEILEAWFAQDNCDPGALITRADALLKEQGAHPLMRALWRPRLLPAIGWIARYSAQLRDEGRTPAAAEIKGSLNVGGITLTGTADRIDRLADGGLAIVDYKTGHPPSPGQVEAGFALQLGLLGLLAGRGAFDGIAGQAELFEYWSLAKQGDSFGYAKPPFRARGSAAVNVGNFVATAEARFCEVAERWLSGGDPFIAKLHPEFAFYGDYDQLMRRDEWYGRG